MNGFTPSQAAVLTGLPLSAIRKALDKEAIPSRLARVGRSAQRMVPLEALLCLKLEKMGVGGLPLAHRKRIYRSVLAEPHAQEWPTSEATVVRAEAARTSLKDAIDRLRQAEERVNCDPEIQGGVPVIKGTRIPVHLVARMHAQGVSLDEILQGYPGLCAEDIDLAVLYARANPRRGAKPGVRLPKTAKLVSEKQVPIASLR